MVEKIKLLKFCEKLQKYNADKEQEAMRRMDGLKKYSNYGNPLFYKQLQDKIHSHPDFAEDFSFLKELDLVAEVLPEFKVPLPYPLSAHLQHKGSLWRLIPHTVFEPTEGQILSQINFAETAGKLAGTKGLPYLKMAKLLRGKKFIIKKKKIPMLQRRIKKIVRTQYVS